MFSMNSPGRVRAGFEAHKLEFTTFSWGRKRIPERIVGPYPDCPLLDLFCDPREALRKT